MAGVSPGCSVTRGTVSVGIAGSGGERQSGGGGTFCTARAEGEGGGVLMGACCWGVVVCWASIVRS